MLETVTKMWVSPVMGNSLLTNIGNTKYKTVPRMYRSLASPVLGFDNFN